MDSTKTKHRKVIAAHEKQLPWEMIEEILSRVSPKSLARFKTVCKQWNGTFDDKTFINNHKETFRFILKSNSKIYSVSIDPKIVVRELTLDILGLESQKHKTLVDCDEFVVFNMDKGAVIWNPWLKQSTWISEPSFNFQLIGCGSDQDSVYKTIWLNMVDYNSTHWKIHDSASGTWKDLGGNGSNQKEGRRQTLHILSGVSLNGYLFAIVYYKESDPLYRLVIFDFSLERFFNFCDLPCGMSDDRDALVFRVFKGDRFSLLKQCFLTKKIEIWVTKNKVNVKDGKDVVWVNFMTLSIPNFPSLVIVPVGSHYQQPSYFIDDKRLVVCSCDENGKAWIYVLGENKLISKVQLDSVVGSWPSHCTYFPSLVPVPRGRRDEANLQV